MQYDNGRSSRLGGTKVSASGFGMYPPKASRHSSSSTAGTSTSSSSYFSPSAAYAPSSTLSSTYSFGSASRSAKPARRSCLRTVVYACVFMGYSILLILVGFTLSRHSPAGGATTSTTTTSSLSFGGPSTLVGTWNSAWSASINAKTDTGKESAGGGLRKLDPSANNNQQSLSTTTDSTSSATTTAVQQQQTTSTTTTTTTNAAPLPVFQGGSFKLPAPDPLHANKHKASSSKTSTVARHDASHQHDRSSRQRFWPVLDLPVPTQEDLAGTAIVTMATGDESARHAIALIQSLRDTNTKVPTILILLIRGGPGSADCQDGERRRRLDRDHIICDSMDTIDEEIVSKIYLETFGRLGASYIVLDPLPETPYINKIPGGSKIAWGMALNKLHVFSLVEYSKILWMDSDTLVLNNVDHLLLRDEFTAAFTNDCCNRNADAKMSGGMWVFKPTTQRMQEVLDLISKPIPGTEDDGWMFGDMQVVLHLFGKITPKSEGREWPFSRDVRQGTVPGIRVLPAYVNQTDEELEILLLQGGRRGHVLHEPGILPAEEMEAKALGKTTWKMLDPRYDGLVGNCECIPERDLTSTYMSVHFTCLPVVPPVHKPGRYTNEDEFLSHTRGRMYGCMRYYFLRWYDAFARAMGSRLPEPYYEGPEVRLNDPDADEEVVRVRKEAFDTAVEAERVRNELAAALDAK